MIIDSSAFLAILQNEPESRPFRDLIEADPMRLTSAVTIFETSMVALARKGETGVAIFRAFVEEFGIETVPLTAEHADLALDAFRRFGKGRHAAGLNFGDCLSYALARATGQNLLFKGEDFALTDIAAAA